MTRDRPEGDEIDAVQDKLAARLVRGRRLDRNPLRRACDRAGTVVLGVLLAGFAAAPFTAHAAGALAIALVAASGLTRRILDRRRVAAWDADWLATGPRWSPRR